MKARRDRKGMWGNQIVFILGGISVVKDLSIVYANLLITPVRKTKDSVSGDPGNEQQETIFFKTKLIYACAKRYLKTQPRKIAFWRP